MSEELRYIFASYIRTLRQLFLWHLSQGEEGNGSGEAAGAIIIAIVIIVGGFLLWSYTEPTWWESLFGVTRWDKLMETVDKLLK